MKRYATLCLFTLFATPSWSQTLQVSGLKCEYKENPLGVEQSHPHLSWQLLSEQRGVMQSAYRVIVADDSTLLQKEQGNVWDSKKTTSTKSIQVAYEGKSLQPAKTYYWRVMVWDGKNNTSGWSATNRWQMGLPQKADWKDARWIAYEKLADSNKILPFEHGKGKKEWGARKDILPLLRKEFTLNKSIKEATLFICGLGQFECNLNGKKVGDHFLDPAWTQYDKESQYVSFDVKNQLKQGANAIGVMLGNGFYYIPGERYRKMTGAFGYPKMICRLAVTYTDGSSQDIVSDLSWKATPGPITFSSIYGGEDYNANLEQKGWDNPAFDDKKWRQVVETNAPASLRSQMADPVKVMQTLEPVKISKTDSGEVYVYDLGQNASGIPQVQVKGKKGDTIRIVHGELLAANGFASQKNIGGPSYFEYVLKGDGVETWQPRFMYSGFRYLQLERAVPTGKANPHHWPEVISLKGLHVSNAAARIGSFSCSNTLFNRTDTLIDWAVRSNTASIFTDCPHREKLGWLEQLHLMGNSLHYNYDFAPLFRKVVRDMIQAQTEDGLVPEIAPEYVNFGGIFRDSPEWASSCILLPWYMYQWYGDREILEESYPTMKRYVAYLKTMAADSNILTQGLSDWYDLGPKPPGFCQLTTKGITATATYYHDLDILNQIATVLRKKADAIAFQKQAEDVKRAFNNRFFNAATKQYGTGSQTGNSMPVYMNLVAAADKKAVVDNIVKDIRERKNALTAGDVGYRYLLKVLAAEGKSDVIFDMNSREDVPGYGYQLAHGATALTESWQALPTVSNNHLMLGHIMEWFYENLAGIRQAPGSIGFREIEIYSEPVGDVTTAKASYQSPYGLVANEWKKVGVSFEQTTTIPANAQATVYLPETTPNKILESGKSIKGRKDIYLVKTEAGRTVIKIGSGTYHFTVTP